MEDVLAKTILTELREFRQENNKRWEENEKHWEENNKRWKENEKRWEQNELQRKKHIKELFEVLDAMDKSISKQIDNLEKQMNTKYNEILENQYKTNKEILLIKRELESQEARMNFQNVRIDSLEKWRDSLGDDFIGVG